MQHSMKSRKIWIALEVSLALAPALVIGNTFEPIFELLSSLWSIVPMYESNPYPIDLVIAILIFGGMASYLLGERFGKLAAWGIGSALAIAFVGYEYANKTSFILKVGPIALIIASFGIAFIFFRILSGIGFGAKTALALAIVIVFIIVTYAFPDLLRAITNTAFGRALITILAVFFLVIVISILWGIMPRGAGLGNERGSAPIINDIAGLGARGISAGGRGFSWLAGKAGDALRMKLSERKLNRAEEQANELVSNLEKDLIADEREELGLLGRMIGALQQVNAMQQAGRMDPTRLSSAISRIIEALHKLITFLSKARGDASVQHKEIMNLKKIESIESRLAAQETQISKLQNGKEFEGPAREIRQLQENLNRLETEQINAINQEGRQIQQELAAIDNEIRLCDDLGRILEDVRNGKMTNALPFVMNKLQALYREIEGRVKRSGSLSRAMDRNKRLSEMQEALNDKMAKLEEEVRKFAEVDSKMA